MSNPRKLYFRTMAAVLAALTTFFTTGREWTEAVAAERASTQALEEQLRHLKLDARRVQDPDGWAAAERAKAKTKREAALKELDLYTGGAKKRERAAKANAAADSLASPEAKMRRELAKLHATHASK